MKIVSLASGGIDSSLMMAMLQEEGHVIWPLFLNYGQLSKENEWKSCKKISNYLKLIPYKIDIANFGKVFKSGITNPTLDIHDDAFLPNRNLLFLLIASSYAYYNEIYVVSIGLLKNPIFPDQTKNFIDFSEKCIQESLGVDMKILSPMIKLDTIDIYKLAKEYDLPFELTYYCHSGNNIPCGKCIACLEHIYAQKELNIKINTKR